MSNRRFTSFLPIASLAALIGATLLIGHATPASAQDSTATPAPTSASTPIATASSDVSTKTVFLIMMENHDWSQILGNPSAAYINHTLLRLGAHTDQYFNPPGIHPSEPNYLWLEAGTNFKILNDGDPLMNKIDSTAHLTTLLEAAGLSWKAYMEGLDGASCPQYSSRATALKHNPTLFFSDVTDNFSAKSAHCIAHERPYTELATDLAANTVPNYSFIVPNLCNDMHDAKSCPASASTDTILNGDTWLSQQIPVLLKSQTYQNGAIVFITWDEGEGNDGPIGFIALSKSIKPGYSNTIAYSHSSTLRTVQEIFGVTPLLGDAANATDLSDLFTTFP